ncbi:MAG: hypothetical protein E7223_04680 [Clostridiales bacterium]|nr:hypothetical protein [Clostridiales bacterium]
MKKRKKRLGDRYDGRKVRSLPPMAYLVPYIMTNRADSQNYFSFRIDIDAIEKYIREKRNEGLEEFGFMHVFVASYVRMVSQRPAINRFIAGHKIYQSDRMTLSMMVKKSMDLNAQETAIKVHFEPEDSIYDVHRRMNEAVTEAKKEGDSTALDSVARALFKLPSPILAGVVGLMRFLDYFGIMPKIIHKASPFHATFFVSNLGSLGIAPIYHHVYNFGHIPVFLVFGAKETKYEMNKDGEVIRRRYIDCKVVTDERITDGHYFATAFKLLQRILKNPAQLDQAPETVAEDIE